MTADLGSSRWIRLRDVSASKEKEKYPSTLNILIAWPISRMNSCSSSQPKVPIVTLSLRTNGKSCLGLDLIFHFIVHACLETRSTCQMIKAALFRYCTTLMLPSPLKRCTGKRLKCQERSRFHAMVLHSHHSTQLKLSLQGAAGIIDFSLLETF